MNFQILQILNFPHITVNNFIKFGTFCWQGTIVKILSEIKPPLEGEQSTSISKAETNTKQVLLYAVETSVDAHVICVWLKSQLKIS